MSHYGEQLKKLIKFTDMKMSSVADIAGYDLSYISKWCNKNKLPASRVASEINRNLGKAFAKEIINQGEIENFCTEFSVSVKEEQLEVYIYTILKEAFKKSSAANDNEIKKNTVYNARVLVARYEIREYLTKELPEMIRSSSEPVDILGTFDICEMLRSSKFDFVANPELKSQIRIKTGIDINNLSKEDYINLYTLINTNYYISFDFYDNENFKNQNLIVIKNKVALLCSLDSMGEISLGVIINDPEKVAKIYERTESMFKINHLLITATTSKEMMHTGYRSNFYAYGDFQMFLARGCEFFLPLNMADKLKKIAAEQGFDVYMQEFFKKLLINWEDIFSKEKADFYILKSRIFKYIEDGEIYFTDIHYKMTVEERKEHINHLIELSKKNPKLNFFIIDDEKIPYSIKNIDFSLYNNHNKLFIKNIKQFESDFGPQFYSILNEKIINDITNIFEGIKEKDFVTHYNYKKLEDFMDRYGGMVYRMLSLSELNDLCM